MTHISKRIVEKEKHIFYVSVGAKEAMYTLRKMIISNSSHVLDSYICNLSSNQSDAIAKAKDYFDQILVRSEKILPNIDLAFSPEPEHDTTNALKSRKVLSDDRITQIENGITPIGSYRGFLITELPEAYILWLADQYTGQYNTKNDRVFQTLASVALGIALERNLFELKALSKDKGCHLGDLGQRINFKAVITEYSVNLSFYGNKLEYTLNVDGKTLIINQNVVIA